MATAAESAAKSRHLTSATPRFLVVPPRNDTTERPKTLPLRYTQSNILQGKLPHHNRWTCSVGYSIPPTPRFGPNTAIMPKMRQINGEGRSQIWLKQNGILIRITKLRYPNKLEPCGCGSTYSAGKSTTASSLRQPILFILNS